MRFGGSIEWVQEEFVTTVAYFETVVLNESMCVCMHKHTRVCVCVLYQKKRANTNEAWWNKVM